MSKSILYNIIERTTIVGLPNKWQRFPFFVYYFFFNLLCLSDGFNPLFYFFIIKVGNFPCDLNHRFLFIEWSPGVQHFLVSQTILLKICILPIPTIIHFFNAISKTLLALLPYLALQHSWLHP